MQLIGIINYILKFFQAILAGNTRLQKKEDGELKICKRARNKAAKQRRRTNIPPCLINKLNTETFRSGDARKPPNQDSNIQISSQPNYEPWNKYHHLNQNCKPDPASINHQQRITLPPQPDYFPSKPQENNQWMILPLQSDYFLSKPQENNQHLSNNLTTPEPLNSPSKSQEAQEGSADLHHKPSSPSNPQERDLLKTDEGPLPKPQGGFISLFYHSLQGLWDPSPRVPQRHQGSSAQDQLTLDSEGSSQNTGPSPVFPGRRVSPKPQIPPQQYFWSRLANLFGTYQQWIIIPKLLN